MKICIIGLGYVGLPLLINLSKHFQVLGYDLDKKKIANLKKFILQKDLNINKKKLKKKNVEFSYDRQAISKCNIIIVAVPTPVKNQKPDLSLLKKACIDIGKNLKKNSIIIFESTVYPGVSEKICAPLIQKCSGLKYKKNFNIAYSPERINPGDKNYTLEKLQKVISADSSMTLKKVKYIYSKIVKKIYLAESIQVAEAAKAIENAQRDINIAFMNEIANIFDKMNINTQQVLRAARSKWNFVNFRPGLVGGHCIGVDPYYLAHIAKKNNYNPKIILAGRDINEKMPNYVFSKISKNFHGKLSKLDILITGITFKENCSDIRNSKIIDLYKLLVDKCKSVTVYDPIAKPFEEELLNNYSIKLKNIINYKKKFDVCVLAVNHNFFKKKINLILKKTKEKSVFFDVMSGYRESKIKKYNKKYLSL
ncbi:nucleotide sugar dehydrogenase [Pelagibacteraceae bacterium]|nr:nucleotide sugar dehydrogenase [Pelagibacteraceae bacterium]